MFKYVDLYARTNTGDIWCYLKTQSSTGISLIKAVGQKSLQVTGFSDGQIHLEFGVGIYIPEKTLVTLVADVSAGTPLISAVGELELYAS